MLLSSRRAIVVIGALTTCVAAASVDGQPVRRAFEVTCTNTASGTSWQVSIDYDRSTVDSNPARITDSRIEWHDAKDGGNYMLDRTSGEMTVVMASSTGGYFLHHRCKLPP